MSIHSTAVVDPHAEIGSDASIGAYSVIGHDVKLGDRVRIGPHVVIEGRTTIGEDTEIFPFTILGSTPGHLKDRGEGMELVVWARVTVREHVSLHRGTKGGKGRTVIGDECSLMACSHVGHDCVLEKGVILTSGARLGGHVEIEEFAIVGGNVGVHQFCRIGCMVMVGAGTTVRADVPPYCLCVGETGRLVGLNEVGLERRGISGEIVKGLKSAYRTIFRSGLRREDAVAKVRTELAAVPEVMHFADFVAATKRGMARHGRG